MISWVEIKDGMLLALASLKENKLRAGLTILGVLIGVGAVISMASMIAGLNKLVTQEIENMGSNVIYVTKFAPFVDHDQLTEEERNRKPIDFEVVEAIRDLCPSIDAVAPRIYYRRNQGTIVKYRENQGNDPEFFGTLPEYQKVGNRFVDRGRFITDLDVERRTTVCVLGSDVAAALFPNEDPIGKDIRVNSRQFAVVGVMEKKKPFLGESENNFVIIPFSTFVKYHPWQKNIFIQARAVSQAEIPQAIEQVTAIMRQLRGIPPDKPDDFAIWTQESLKEKINEITRYIYIAMIVISSVGLMVGGVGVMNIMLVSVTERTREIGVRKAIGARRVNILIQFLTEAVTLSGSGGILGIVFGILVAVVINLIFSMPFTVSMLWVFIGFTVSVSVGLVAGIYPAYKAARVDPIVSLRYE